MVKRKGKGNRKTTALTMKQMDFILDELEECQDYRVLIICLIMAKTLRIADAVGLRVGDLYDKKGKIQEAIYITERKTSKPRKIILKGERLLTALKTYHSEVKHLKPTDPAFYTLKKREPLHPQGVRRVLQRKFKGTRGIKDISGHSFRKFGARQMYLNNVRIETISHLLNHNSTRDTFVYIDITPAEEQDALKFVEI